MQSSRYFIMLGHTVLAGFFLPAALLFSVTGGLYTWKITGNYQTQSFTVPLEINGEPNLSEALEAARGVLAERQVAEPTGNAAIKKAGTSWQLEWTGSRMDMVLEPTVESGLFKVAFKETGAHRFFVQLHKAKGGLPFKFMAAGLALAFCFIFLSGVMLAYSHPGLRPKMYWSLGLGTVAFALMAYLS